ncbi:ATP-dependent nuclease [Leptospira terpstrae]|uniref:ATP-dependent nuclease n=1 Tax=Leptospira terpstrae TaxID=293075 RepID=UPI003D044D8A
MLTKIKIRNFRSIKYIETDLTDLNAVIGPNSSGKSNILRALNLILGQTYANIKSFSLEDFYNFDTSNHIEIDVYFKKVLKCDPEVKGFRLFNDGNSVSYIAIDTSGNPCTYYKGNEKKVSNAMKEEVPLLYLNLDRQSTQQIKPSQWTLYGKLLNVINERISKEDNDNFISDLNKTYQDNVFPYVEPIESMLTLFVKEQTGKLLNLNMSVIDPSMILKDLRPRIKDNNGFEIDIDKEGAGIQSAVTIAIARTYAEVTKMPLIIAIEEPEIFLHPHGCRHFYSILKNLSNSGVQVFYTTHRESFIDIREYQSIKLVKKKQNSTEIKSFSGKIEDFDEIKASSKFDPEMNEVFFAEKAILVEGAADKISIKLAFEKLNKDLDSHNISIIECQSLSGIKPMIDILNHFDIDCFVVADEDPGNQTTESHIKKIKNVLKNHSEKLFIQSPDLEGIYNYQNKFTKETALKETPNLLDKSIPSIYKDLLTKLGI